MRFRVSLTLSFWLGCFMLAQSTLHKAAADDAASEAAIPDRQPDAPAAADLEGRTVEELEQQYADATPPEAVRMYLAILKGSRMGAGEGWFRDGESPYGWAWLADKHGVPADSGIAADQFLGPRPLFDRLDRDRDGRITPIDLDWSEGNPWVRYAYLANRMFRKIDPSGDGRLSREEWLAFFDKAAQGSEDVTSDTLRDLWLEGMTAGFLPGDEPTQERLLQGFFSGDVGSMQEGPAVGDPAPDFELETVGGDRRVRLSGLFGSKPIVLVFGNFTCGPFRSMYPDVERVRERFGDQAEFLAVYVREAHPTDGWQMQSNDRVGVAVAQPKTYAERQAVAQQCQARLKYGMPLLVDDAQDSVGHAYSGMPARLYVIDRTGRVAYKGGRGPFGFKAGEMEQALVMTLLDQSLPSGAPDAGPVSHAQPRVPLLSDEEAWAGLPEAEAQPRLPNWARGLAATLPHTTAAMLELDFACRTTPEFTPRERGLIRRAVASVNRSAYGLAYADAELRAAGLSESDLGALNSGDWPALSEQERRITAYAAQASLAARDLTDEQVAKLRADLGDDRLVGLVLLTAYANFQDRLVHALALPLESDGPLPPAEVRFQSPESTPGGSLVQQAARPELPAASGPDIPRPVWIDFNFDALQDRLEQQRDREARIDIPTWEEMIARLPTGLYNPNRPLRIRWSRLVIGRQPTIGPAWIKCLRVFGNEAHQDRAFEESVFWVVTRDLRCFYCMGHCEMLMEVGGLSRDQISDRTRRMADGNWSEFAPAERAAFAMASKMTRTPWAVSDADFEALVEALGRERAIDAIWWIARCQFMTKVSDTFQLQLERENVFEHFEPPAESAQSSSK
ncbi:MAG: deiodinase family protein [Planctomyces sp.]|nr:deiodinase family protein [Planctomyces sp.]